MRLPEIPAFFLPPPPPKTPTAYVWPRPVAPDRPLPPLPRGGCWGATAVT